MEGNLGIASAFQNFLVHLAVTHATSAVAAGCIHNDLALYFPGWLELQRSVLQLESSVDGMQDVAEREFHRGLSRIKLERRILRGGGKNCPAQECDDQGRRLYEAFAVRDPHLSRQ